MSKNCDRCKTAYKGFGTTCPDCRKRGSVGAGPSAPGGATVGGDDVCAACNKKAYAMEKMQVEGMIFHKMCFCCDHCKKKLDVGGFSKTPEGTFYCKVHYERLFKVRGRLSIGHDEPGKPDREASLVTGEAAVTATAEPSAAEEIPAPAGAAEPLIAPGNETEEAAAAFSAAVVAEETASKVLEE